MGAKVTDTAAALVTEATARFARRQFADAKNLCQKALATSADTAEAWHVLGMIAIQELRDSEAVEMISRAVALAPGVGPAYANLGVAYQNIGNLAQAIANFRQAAALTPRSAPVHVFLAHAQLRAERWQEAADAYAKALALGARGFELHGSYGQALRNLGQLPAAANQFLRARKLNPKDPVAAVELGEVRLALGDHAGAVKALKDAATLLPHVASVANNLGLAFKGMGSYPEAEAALQRAIALQPQLADAWLNLGGVRQAQERFDEALADYAHARSLGSRGAEALYNMATVHDAKGDLPGAIELYRQALAEKPDYPDARRNKGLDQLKLGQLSEGWVDYEARWDCADYAAVRGRFSQPSWDGARDLDGALLVWGEQGLGDEILYGTMVPELMDAGMRIVRELDPRLVPLVQRSWPDMRAIARQPQSDPATRASDIAAQIPLGNLGRYLRAHDAAFPAHPPAFKPDPERVAAYRKQLRPEGTPSFVVGISWVSRNLEIGAQKSTSLADWSGVLQVPGVRFVNLQYGDTARDLTKFARTSGVSVQTLPNLDLTNDIDGLAALIAACDLVVTVSNTTAHLAGALGVPAWVLVPTGNAKLWYWGQSGATTPWYPSLRLFRQVEPRKWDAPIAAIADALANDASRNAGAHS